MREERTSEEASSSAGALLRVPPLLACQCWICSFHQSEIPSHESHTAFVSTFQRLSLTSIHARFIVWHAKHDHASTTLRQCHPSRVRAGGSTGASVGDPSAPSPLLCTQPRFTFSGLLEGFYLKRSPMIRATTCTDIPCLTPLWSPHAWQLLTPTRVVRCNPHRTSQTSALGTGDHGDLHLRSDRFDYYTSLFS